MSKTFTSLLMKCTGAVIAVIGLLLLNQNRSLAQSYCIPSTGILCPSDEYISDVTVNGASNPSACSSYTDYSGSVTFSGYQGQDVPFSININNFFSSDDIAIFIDWNNDMDFNDPGELVFQAGFSGSPAMANPQTGTFPASLTATPGLYRMRIYLTWGVTTADPCATTWTYGEAEDYTFQLTPAPSCSPVSASSFLLGNNDIGSATISWANAPGAQSYNIRYRKTTDPVSVNTWANPTNQIDNIINLSGLETCVTYIFQVQTVCAGGDTALYTNYTFNAKCYCIPTTTYCDEYISNVTIGATSNPTACNTGFNDYTNITFNVQASNPATASVTFGNVTSSDGVSIFVDWNNDMDFGDPGEMIYNLTSITGSTVNAGFTVPAVPDGNYRMRVRLYYYSGFGDPCLSSAYGEIEDYTLNVGPAPSCVGITNLAMSNLTISTADITWSPSATAVSYNVRYKSTLEPTSVSTWATPVNTTDTSVTLTGLDTCKTYQVQVQSDCGGGDTSTYSFLLTFSSACYCIPTTTYCDEYISNVTIGATSNPTACNTGFNDYTNITFNVQASNPATASVTFGNVTSSDGVSIFVDWNNDMDFGDPGEMIYNLTSITGSTVNAGFTVPAVPDGNYRMRVRLYYYSGFGDPCLSSAYGEIEDYTLNVGPAPSCVGITNLAMSNLTISTADITWSPSATAVSYNVRYKSTLEPTSVSTWATPVNTTDTSVTLTGLDTCKTYQVQVQSDCGGGDTSTYSFLLTFSSACYCTAYATICDEYIANVSIGSTSNPTDCSAAGYTNYSSSVQFNVEAGACAQVIVQNGSNLWSSDQCGVWIDWNGDLDFNDPGETIPVAGSPGVGPYIGQISVPGNQAPGSYRMRVIIQYGGGLLPCGNIMYGEVEDYALTVNAGSTCTGVGIVSLNGQTQSALTLDWVTGSATSFNVRYKLTSEDETAATWVNPINTTTVPFTLTGLDSCAQYNIEVQAICGPGDTSAYSCTVTFGTLCCIDPLPLANHIEQEACGEDHNGGCNSINPNDPSSYEPIACGDKVAGTAWWDGSTRDTDWYLLNLSEPKDVVVTFTSAFLGQLYMLDASGGCASPIFLNQQATTQQCGTIIMAGNLPAGSYWLFAAPQFDYSENYPCGGGKNNYLLSVECSDPVPAPINDSCSHAIAVNCGDTITGSTMYATPDAGLPFCGTTPQSNGVWYTITGDGSFITASLCNGTTYDTKINIYTGSCGAFTCVAGNDDYCGSQSQVTFQSVAGTTYYIYVNGYTASSGDFTLTITCEFPPAYDNVCGALALNYGVNGPFNTAMGSIQPGEPVPPLSGCQTQTGWCSATISNTLWFTFTAPASGHVSVHSPGFDTQLAIWTADSCGGLLNGGATFVAANDDDPNYIAHGGAIFSSYLELKCLTPGALFYVQLDPYSSPGGTTPIILTDLGPLASTDFSGLDPIYCNGASAVTLTPVTPGGTFAGPGVTGTVFNPVAAGVGGPYNITYTLESCNVTTKTTSVEQISASATATATSCGLDNGSVDLTAGGSNTLTYVWSNAATTEDLSNLSTGTYHVTVTSAGGCTASANATVDPSIGITVLPSVTDEDCGTSNGSIVLTAFGNGTVSYIWSDGATTGDIHNLSAGIYTVTMTDDNNCTLADTLAVAGTPAVTVTGTPHNVTCGVLGAIDLTINSGMEPFAYSWSNGATTQDIVGIGAGNYSVTVADVNGCSATYASDITSVGSPINVSVTPQGPLTSCHMAFHVTLTATSLANTEYKWYRGQFGQGYNLMQVGGNTYQPNTPDTRKYFVVAKDTVTGCSDTSNTVIVTLNAFDKPVINIGDCVDHKVQLSTTNYGGGFTYTWYHSDAPISGATSNTYIAQTWGGYRVKVTDSCGVAKFAEPISLSTDCFKTTGIENVDANGNGVNIYPNPNNGSFNVEIYFEGANYQKATFEIFNIIGQRVMDKEITFVQGYVNVPVSMNDVLADGVYTIRIQLGNEEVIRKVVVNRN